MSFLIYGIFKFVQIMTSESQEMALTGSKVGEKKVDRKLHLYNSSEESKG